jgi:hypothetical protein
MSIIKHESPSAEFKIEKTDQQCQIYIKQEPQSAAIKIETVNMIANSKISPILLSLLLD